MSFSFLILWLLVWSLQNEIRGFFNKIVVCKHYLIGNYLIYYNCNLKTRFFQLKVFYSLLICTIIANLTATLFSWQAQYIAIHISSSFDKFLPPIAKMFLGEVIQCIGNDLEGSTLHCTALALIKRRPKLSWKVMNMNTFIRNGNIKTIK